jgi:hypothetical protein
MIRPLAATCLALLGASVLGCGSGTDLDASTSGDAPPGDGAASATMDAPTVRSDAFVGGDTSSDPADALGLDAPADACAREGGAGCGGGALTPCEAAAPALDVSFTMTTAAAGTSTSAMVRARHFLTGDVLTEQRTREEMTVSGTATDLLRVWRAATPSSQSIYSIAPATPHPTTLEPRARRDERAVTGRFDALATFPTYAMAMLECLDAADPERCLSGGGTLLDARRDELVDGQPCRVMSLGPSSEGVTVCVPQSCERRRTLYPLSLDGPGVTVTFTSLTEATHAENVVQEPAPCETAFSLVLCDHPDL